MNNLNYDFMYGELWYRYKEGWIYYQTKYNNWQPLCPVIEELNSILSSLDGEHLRLTLSAIVGGYGCGVVDGKKKQVQEFKRLFDLT
jgi:hypothetical protein